MPGLLSLLGLAGVYDAWAKFTNHQTISGAVWSLRQPWRTAFWFGWATLTVHFLRKR